MREVDGSMNLYFFGKEFYRFIKILSINIFWFRILFELFFEIKKDVWKLSVDGRILVYNNKSLGNVIIFFFFEWNLSLLEFYGLSWKGFNFSCLGSFVFFLELLRV